jgi:SAM-dependent methyltransferase
MARVDSFEKNVERYESWFERNRPTYESELEAIRVMLPRSGKGLEIGVGTGLFAAPLGVRFGIDPSMNMVRAAMRRGVEVILGAGENLPCKEGSFDILLMVTTICFLDDVPRTLKEAYRVLTNGGCIVIGFIDRESLLGRVYETYKKGNLFYKDATFLSADDVLFYLKQTGFSDFVFRQTIFGNPAEMKEIDPVKLGYGEGSFVIVRGKKAFQQKKNEGRGVANFSKSKEGILS